jgi:hypothetical protein
MSRAAVRGTRSTPLATDATPEGLLQGAYRAAAAYEHHTLAARRLAKALHDVVAKEIGEQDHDLGTDRQWRGAALVGAVAAADMGGDADPELGEHIGYVAESVRTDDERIHAKLLFSNDSH